MPQEVDRRRFLASAAAIAVGLGVGGRARAQSAGAPTTPAPAAPVFKTKPRKALIQNTPTEAYLNEIKAAGFEGLESRTVAPAEAEKIRDVAEKLGMRIHSVLLGTANFNSPDASVVQKGFADSEAAIRSAQAFGADAVLLDPETADPLGRRPVRVSMGHVLHVPFARLDPWPDALGLVREAGLTVVALAIDGDDGLDDVPERAAFVVGAEGPGLTQGARERADRCVRIPMVPEVDSVNVATAAAIALSAHFSRAERR
jgi:tRNA(Leu) C34 or U34 (ribose-2'-O)-methylase TrmL